jgi:hypothetical protein
VTLPWKPTVTTAGLATTRQVQVQDIGNTIGSRHR